MTVLTQNIQTSDPAYVIVLGNSKGGSGKSTTGMHIITRLLNLGFQVGAIDLDGRQRTLGRYAENRQELCESRKVTLPMPDLRILMESQQNSVKEAQADEQMRFVETLQSLRETNHFVVVDCPGNDNFLSRLAHAYADTLITPLNDSFIDVDLLARVNPNTYDIISPSWYSEMVWEQRKQRFLRDKKNIDWVVVRNRLSHTDARNKRHVQQVLEKLSQRIGFRHVCGFGERVIFRELFLKGLTLSDLRQKGLGVEVTMAHVAANQEVKALVSSLKLPHMQQEKEGTSSSHDKTPTHTHTQEKLAS